jgi:purine-binding chemotaxis protein CheW
MNAPRQFCTFVVNEQVFGVDVRQVQEVLRYQEMTRVPLGSPVLGGLLNLRGQIVTAIDLRRRLGLPEGPASRRSMNVVVRTSDGVASLLVDAIGDVEEVGEESFERPPDTLSGPVRDLILGVYKLPGHLLLVLDADEAVRVPAGNSLLNHHSVTCEA